VRGCFVLGHFASSATSFNRLHFVTVSLSSSRLSLGRLSVLFI
jgi:hypothetical protein